MIVFDDEDIGMTVKHVPQLARSVCVPRRACWILGSRCEHYRRHPPIQRRFEATRHCAEVVDGQRDEAIPERSEKIEDRCVTGILNRDTVAWPQPRPENSLYAVESSGDNRDVRSVYPVGGQALSPDPTQGSEDSGLAIEPLRVLAFELVSLRDGAQCGYRRQECRVGSACAQVDRPGGHRHRESTRDRWRRTDSCAAPALTHDDAAPR